MPHYAALHQGLQCLQKYLLTVIQSEKDKLFEPQHEIYIDAVCATSKASDQPAHMRSLIRAFASHLNIL